MSLPNVALLSPDARETAAGRAKAQPDITPWPPLSWFNSAPCSAHVTVNPLCPACGVELRAHQRTGAAWLYLAGKGLIADTVGSGKTAIALAVLAMCKEHGELSPANRAVIVCKANAVGQWAAEVRRLLPGVAVYAAHGDRQERIAGYMGTWEVVVVSDRTFAPARGNERARDGDVEYIRQFPVGILVYDDIDAMRNHTTQTSYAICRLAEDCTRVIGLHGTPLQKRLVELWCFLQPVGGRQALGPISRVRQRYVTQRKTYLWFPDKRDPTGQRKYRRTIYTDIGVREERLPEFKGLIAPLIMRRTAGDMADVNLPVVQSHTVWLDLSARQRARYDELREGSLRRLRDGVEEVSYVDAAAAFTRGWQICAGLATLDDTDDSVKLDWVMETLTGDLEEEKVVCFVYHRPNVAALSQRLTAAGIGHELMWSSETDSQLRDARLHRFRTDPDCRVLVGTTTIETSLNLQSARHLIAVDTVLNAQRMTQIVGRIKRQGSAWPVVIFHHLLARNTQEEGYLELLGNEQAMADAVWDESGNVFSALGPRQLMNLVAYGHATV